MKNQDEKEDTSVAMLYNLNGLLRSDILFDFPLPAKSALYLSNFIVPSTLALQVYYSQEPSIDNFVKLGNDGVLNFDYRSKKPMWAERKILRSLFDIGFFSHEKLVKYANPGKSIHYAGCLPMKTTPKNKYETWPNGLLFGHKNTYVVDSSLFPRLPAKNLTFTIMANAIRIGEMVSKTN
ncbi:MAG: GMC family oxidoreductase [Cytophagales bacterium]|nr:GMC family oxidoreductase [Cytophagales bacterium]